MAVQYKLHMYVAKNLKLHTGKSFTEDASGLFKKFKGTAFAATKYQYVYMFPLLLRIL